jgi:type I restriction enzyme S subunit
MTPEGWRKGRVSSFGEVVAGKAKNTSGNGDSRPYLRVANVFDGRIDISDVLEMPFTTEEFARYQLAPGDILLNEGQSLELVGRCAMYRGEYPGPCAIQNALVRFRAGPQANPVFAEQLFRWYQRTGIFAEIATQTTSIAHLGVKRFADLELLFPPLPEQRKIAAILSSVDEAVESTQAVIDQLGVVKKAMMAELLTRGLPGRHTRFKQTEIGEVPEEWEVVRMDQLAVPGGMVGGPFGSDLTAKDYVREPGVPVIRGGNVSMGRFWEADFVFVSREKANALARNAATSGDLVMTQRGASLGEVTLLPHGGRHDFYIISQTMMRMTPDASKVCPRYLLHYTCSDAAQRWLQNHQIATGQPHLNLGIYREMPALVPKLEEQEAVAEAMDRIDATHGSNVDHLHHLKRVKSALMSVLLTGEVRVKAEEVA